MSSHAPDSAFPFFSNGGVHEHQVYGFGLTKREWFAGMALQGLCANPHAWEAYVDAEYAQEAVDLADALLRALSEPPQ